MKQLLNLLQQHKSSTSVFNQYQHPSVLHNLELYLELCKRNDLKILLVGEAPGYAGCALTGIPFTSNRILNRNDISFFKTIKDKLYISDNTTERSATIVWNALNELDFIPAFWNSFPFHPCQTNRKKSNRAPSIEEVLEGKCFLKMVIEYLKPQIIAGLGKEGQSALESILPNKKIEYIRHPSYGGKPEFVKGLKKLALFARNTGR